MRRRRLLLLAGGAAMLAACTEPVAATPTELPTVEVRKTDLSSTVEMPGTLGFGAGRGVLGGGNGRITWLPAAGAVLRRGDRAYGRDGERVPLLYGSTPFWRELRSGVSDGYDVLELERNLKALGYDVSVDRDFTGATYRAIRAWQKDLGLSRTGVIGPDDVVMQPGPVRVAEVRASLGGSSGGTLFTVSDTRREVSVAVPVGDAPKLARIGARAQVTMPGGEKVTGTITAVGKVATVSKTQEATIDVTVLLPESDAFDGAPVTVAFEGEARRGVLAVPINALLSSGGDKYSVEVVDSAGAITSVPVKLGVFAGDDVEVSGELRAGMKVRVPRI